MGVGMCACVCVCKHTFVCVEGGKLRGGWGDCDMKQGEETLMVC